MTTAIISSTYERIRSTSIPISLVGEGGRLIHWLKKPGDYVQKYEPIATIEANGVEMDVTAALEGVVKLLMFHVGVEVQSGVTLCYVQPTTSSSALKKERRITPASTNDLLLSTKSSLGPLAEQVPSINAIKSDPPVLPSRRSTLGPQPATPIEELTMSEPQVSLLEHQLPSAALKIQRRKTTHKTYHIEESQVQRIKHLSLELQLADQASIDCNESELVRTAIELLLALPRPALIATLYTNREREKQGRYGSGWPRPSKK